MCRDIGDDGYESRRVPGYVPARGGGRRSRDDGALRLQFPIDRRGYPDHARHQRSVFLRASGRECVIVGRRRWRHYQTAAGKRPVLEFIRKVPDGDKAAILAAMQEVRREGTRAARHLRGD